ncbi:hypothetical protein WMF37_01510 [Sorangium sp. So ce291]|uniref:hypothetical protein n=1 Tax=Sorangium sp. So ce291 TaxID=3133294 RepID=UPI003F5E57DF
MTDRHRRGGTVAHRTHPEDGEAMSRKSIQLEILKQIVADAGQQFATNDVSEDERMLAAHPELVSHSHYHAFVGGALSDHHEDLDIVEVQKDTPRGSRWQKRG